MTISKRRFLQFGCNRGRHEQSIAANYHCKGTCHGGWGQLKTRWGCWQQTVLYLKTSVLIYLDSVFKFATEQKIIVIDNLLCFEVLALGSVAHGSKIRLYWPLLYGNSAIVQSSANFLYSTYMMFSTYFWLCLIIYLMSFIPVNP